MSWYSWLVDSSAPNTLSENRRKFDSKIILVGHNTHSSNAVYNLMHTKSEALAGISIINLTN